jgi:sialidase-1
MAHLSASSSQAEDSSRDKAQPLSPELRDRCMSILRTGLKSDEFWPSMHAAEALTLAGAGAEVIEALRGRIELDPDDQHRCGLARELARAGDRSSVPLMFQILGTESSNGRTHAAESLYKIGDIGDGKLMRSAFAQTENPRLQVMAAAALAKSGDSAAYAFLRKNLATGEDSIKDLCAWVLGPYGADSDIAQLSANLKTLKGEASQSFLAVALACRGTAEGRAELMKQLETKNNVARTMASEFVGISRTVEAREKLVALLDDPFQDVRIRAAQSLIVLSMDKK